MSESLCEAFVERACRVCGCTQFNACPSGCWWIEQDLCSECRHFQFRGFRWRSYLGRPFPFRWMRQPLPMSGTAYVEYSLHRYIDDETAICLRLMFSSYVLRRDIARDLRALRRELRERAHATQTKAA